MRGQPGSFVTKPCLNCGTDTPQFRKTRPTPYCCKACWLEDKAKPIKKECPHCKNEFQVPAHPSSLRKQKHCSDVCRYAAASVRTQNASQKLLLKPCKGCGLSFHPNRANRLYCSHKCCTKYRLSVGWRISQQNEVNLYKRMRKMDLPCRACGLHGKTEIHHKDGDPTNNVDINLVPLCSCCHRMLHVLCDSAQSGLKKFSEYFVNHYSEIFQSKAS